MRVLLVSWEFPPVVVGGLGRHVHALAGSLAADGHEVVVLSRQPPGTVLSGAVLPGTVLERVGHVRVLRVAEDPVHLSFEDDLVAWTLAMGHALLRAALTRLGDWRPDVVHAHDWLVAHPAVALADVLGVPLVATIHATEAGRHGGWLSAPLNRQVHSVEWWLAHRADTLITCSAAMRDEVARLFDVDPGAVRVLPNGIAPRRWQVPAHLVAAARQRYGGPLLVYFGRLEHEKGVQDLVAALPRIRSGEPGTRLVVIGTGSMADQLARDARDGVHFLGHIPDEELAAVIAAADAVVLPSRYEPFGIVALEAAAAGAPLVAARAGGLAEVVRDGETGLSFPPGDVAALAGAVARVLADPAGAARRAERAMARLATDFDWARIAADTAGVYAAAVARGPVELGQPTIPTGNALTP